MKLIQGGANFFNLSTARNKFTIKPFKGVNQAVDLCARTDYILIEY